MRIAHKLLPTALAVSAAMALTASGASGATVVDEATGVQCSAITESFTAAPSKTEVSGGCPFQSSTASMEFGAPFGVMIICPVYMEGRVSGSGHMIAAIYTVGGNDRLATLPPDGGTTTCVQNWAVPCDATRDKVPSGEVHSELQVTTTITNSAKWNLERNWCVRTYVGTIIDCHIQGTINELANHNYNIVLSGTASAHNGAACENVPGYSLSGTFNLGPFDPTHPKIEISG